MKLVEIRRIQIDLCAQIIGAVLLLVLGRLLGDQGVAYLMIAVNVFWLIWSLTGSYMADALGRMLRARSSRGQYRNAGRLRRTGLMLGIGSGLVGSLLLAVFAIAFSEKIFGIPYIRPLLLVMAPALFLRGIASVLLGWLKGEGTELPTVIVSVARQVLTVIFAILFCKLLESYGVKVSALLGVETFTAMYGGIGVTLGMLIAEALCTLFLGVVYRASRSGGRDRAESQRVSETSSQQVQAFYANAWPQAVREFLSILPLWIGMLLLKGNLSDSSPFTEQYGLLIGRYAPICCIIFLLLAALLTENVTHMAQSLHRDEQRLSQRYFTGGLHGAIAQSVFFAMFLAVTASQLADWLCISGEEDVAGMLRAGAFMIPLALLGYFFTGILAGSNGRQTVLIGLLIADLLYAIASLAALKAGSGVMALIYAGLIAQGVYAAGMGFLLIRQLGCRIDWIRIAVIPTVCSCLIGLAVLFIARAASPHLGNAITVILLLILSYALYWAALLFLRSFREQDLQYFPGGKLLKQIGRLLKAF